VGIIMPDLGIIVNDGADADSADRFFAKTAFY